MAILAKPATNLDPEPSAPPEELLSDDTACAKGPGHGEEDATSLKKPEDIEARRQQHEKLLKRSEELMEEYHKLENIATQLEDIQQRRKRVQPKAIIAIILFLITVGGGLIYVMCTGAYGSTSYSKDHKGEYNKYNDPHYKSRDLNYDIPEGVYNAQKYRGQFEGIKFNDR